MPLQSSGQISFSQIRNELGGPATQGAISMSQYRSGGTYGGQIASNPNGIPSSNSNISFSKFYSAAKWVYPSSAPYNAVNVTNSAYGGWSVTNQDANAYLIWIDPYQNTIVPIANYGINYYFIFQNTSGSDISGTIYVFQDDNANYYLNGTNVANYNYTGNTNSFAATFKVGQNLFQAYVVNGGGPGGLILTFKNSGGGTIMYTNNTWRADARCLLNYYNWLDVMTASNLSGTAYQIEGTNPDRQIRLGFSSGSTQNVIYTTTSGVNYSSFVLYFEIYVATGSGADGLYAFFGSNSIYIGEFGGNNSFTLSFHIWQSRTQGIYLMRGDGTIVASYITSGFIASTWQGVYVYYTKGTSNTWSVYWNGINIFNYSDPNNASFVANAGTYSGIGFRDGGVTGTAYVRHLELYHRV
jgi:hypothetical protein